MTHAPGASGKTFYFLSGLPRSGSTLLGAILTQNPLLYVTPTSPLLDLLCFTQGSWNQIQQTKTWEDPQQLPNVYSGIIQSIFRHLEQPVIIDKHRAWARNIPGLREMSGRNPKIICTVRDIAEVMASFLSLARESRGKGLGNFVDDLLARRGLLPTDENFCDALWDSYVSDPYVSVKTGLETDPSCLHLVEYSDLVERPAETLAAVYRFLDLPAFGHRFRDIVNHAEEKDDLWGFDGLHRLRPELARRSLPAAEILGPALARKFQERRLEFWRAPRREALP